MQINPIFRQFLSSKYINIGKNIAIAKISVLAKYQSKRFRQVKTNIKFEYLPLKTVILKY